MNFRQFLLIILGRKWAVIGVTLFGLVAALTVSFVLPPRYRAATGVVIDHKRLDPISGALFPSQMYSDDMATQVDIIQSHRVALKVVRALRLSTNPVAKQQFEEATDGKGSIEDWLADLLLNRLDPKPSRESSVISIEYTSPDPQFAAVVADAFAKAYIDTNLELRVAPARDTAIWFDEQIKTLRTNLAEAQAKLSAYQREKGYSAIDERLDVENSKLQEISAQMVTAQAAASDANSRLNQLNDFLARGADPANLPDILANQLVQSMKSQLTQSEARLNVLSSQLGANHPELQKLRADIETQRQKIRDEIGNVAAGIKNSYRVAERREAELRQAAATQKARMLELNKGRDDMSVLMKEVENGQRALDAANSRLTQETLQSRSSQTNVVVLSPAVPPLDPRFPRLTINIPVGIFAGLLLGINLALLREFFDRRINLEEDLREVGDLPLLGTLARGRRRTAGRWWLWRRRSRSIRPALA